MAESSPPRQLQPAHTRTYQACIPCRRRKVRCDLGPVDNPRDPPCVRCRRESKECFFSATRRKKRADELEEEEDAGDISDYEVRNGRKRARHSEGHSKDIRSGEPLQINSQISPTQGSYSAGAHSNSHPLTPGGSVGRQQPLRRPDGTVKAEEEDPSVNNAATAMLQTAEVYSGHDALNLLFEAATGRGEDMRHYRTTSTSSNSRPTNLVANTPTSVPSYSSPRTPAVQQMMPSAFVPDSAVDPAISQPYTNGQSHGATNARELALRAWSRFRFVRAGWFTASEAMDYMIYFHDCISPLTPIVVPDFSDYSKHAKFLTEEPMLVITILTISTRHMKLAGPGAHSRPYAIHEKLWTYLQGMVERMIWGQEQFGGGFCGAGAQPSADVNPLSRKGLRTLGTVESLMLLTEWHPRSLHFPPGDDDQELMTPENPLGDTNAHSARLGSGGERVDSWLEPCWRSDRMCWMLLGNAISLAFEIGVFDDTSEIEFREEFQGQPEEDISTYLRRRKILRDLLLIYVTQTSGRLGVTSMLPSDSKDPAFGSRTDPRLQDRLASLRNANKAELDGILHTRKVPSSIANRQDRVLYFWKEISYFIEWGNQKLFPNRRHTRELIKSGHYVEQLQYFNPILREWRKNFEKADIPRHMRNILLIEYEYNRVYVNSLALQAVVERCTNNTPAHLQTQSRNQGWEADPISKTSGTAIPWSTIGEWYGEDRTYISEVIEGSRNVLRIVVDDLLPGEFLKHAPVRTYFRIISVAIVLLKTFALGATADDVAISLSLLDRAVEALRTCIVDDVHVATSFADLCEKLTQRIRSRFVRVAGPGGNGSTGVSRAGTPPTMGGSATAPATAIGPGAFGSSMGPPMQVPQQPNQNSPWSGFNDTSGPGSPNVNTGGRGTPSHSALWGISTESYDPGRNDVSIMPPPSFELYDTNGSNSNGGGDNSATPVPGGNMNPPSNNMPMTNGNANGADDGSGMPDWLALPLDPLLNSYGADVTQTTYGPDVGGQDLLDLLLYKWE